VGFSPKKKNTKRRQVMSGKSILSELLRPDPSPRMLRHAGCMRDDEFSGNFDRRVFHEREFDPDDHIPGDLPLSDPENCL
jgi:hypothetical protein